MKTNIRSRADLIQAVASAAKSASAAHCADLGMPDSVNTTSMATVPKAEGDDRSRQQLPKDGKGGQAAPRDITTVVTDPASVGENVPAASEHPESGDKLAAVVKNFRTMAADLMTPKVATASPDANIEITTEFAVKLARAIYEVEGGAKVIEHFLLAKHGQDQAALLVKSAMDSHHAFLTTEEEMAKSASGNLSEEQRYVASVQQAFANATPEEQAQVIKIASTHQQLRDSLPDHPMIKDAYAAGAESADADMAEAGPEGIGAVAPEAAPEGEEAAEGPHTPEELMQLIAMLVESGEISPEDAEQIMAELSGAMQGGDAGGPPMMEGGGAPMAEGGEGGQESTDEAIKAASAALELVAYFNAAAPK